MKKKYSSKNDTLKHINNVQFKIAAVISELSTRALNHDRSKLEEPELSYFDKYTPKLKLFLFGSAGYNRTKEKMKPALDHHYNNNRHHPEYFTKWVCDTCFREYKKEPLSSCDICGNDLYSQEIDINQMNLIDITEMFCDWIAATERHKTGDIYKSFPKCQRDFNINDQLIDIFKNTALEIFNKTPIEDKENAENG